MNAFRKTSVFSLGFALSLFLFDLGIFIFFESKS